MINRFVNTRLPSLPSDLTPKEEDPSAVVIPVRQTEASDQDPNRKPNFGQVDPRILIQIAEEDQTPPAP